MKNIFAFDMDGTIVDRDSKLLTETKEALVSAREKGHTLMIATGRGYFDIKRDINPELVDYFVANNGAYIYECKKKEFFWNGEVPKNIAKELLEITLKQKAFFAVHVEDNCYRIRAKELTFGKVDDDANFNKFEWFTKEQILEIINTKKIAQVSIRAEVEVVEELKEYFVKKYGDKVAAHIANNIYLDLNPKGISKMFGVNAAIKLSGKKFDNFYSFGDSSNDIDMLKGATIGFAMGNANDEAKSVANEIIGNHNEPSIANKVLELI